VATNQDRHTSVKLIGEEAVWSTSMH